MEVRDLRPRNHCLRRSLAFIVEGNGVDLDINRTRSKGDYSRDRLPLVRNEFPPDPNRRRVRRRLCTSFSFPGLDGINRSSHGACLADDPDVYGLRLAGGGLTFKENCLEDFAIIDHEILHAVFDCWLRVGHTLISSSISPKYGRSLDRVIARVRSTSDFVPACSGRTVFNQTEAKRSLAVRCNHDERLLRVGVVWHICVFCDRVFNHGSGVNGTAFSPHRTNRTNLPDPTLSLCRARHQGSAWIREFEYRDVRSLNRIAGKYSS
jgi:hypothetical protein